MNLVTWLEGCGMSNVEEVTVKIGAESWKGAAYDVTHASGQTERRIYAIGNLPTEYEKARQKVAFLFEGRDWFVSGWYRAEDQTEERQAEVADFHPFGNWFGLHKWTPADAIDKHERKPYTRIPLELAK